VGSRAIEKPFVTIEGGAVAVFSETGRISMHQRMKRRRYDSHRRLLCGFLGLDPVAFLGKRIRRKINALRLAAPVESVPIELEVLHPQIQQLRKLPLTDKLVDDGVLQVGVAPEKTQSFFVVSRAAAIDAFAYLPGDV